MKVFQYITLFLCCGILVCSCTNGVEGSPDENPGNPLLFSCSVTSARGSQTTGETLNSMGVIGFETGILNYGEWKKTENSAPNFMNNQSMERVNGNWIYSPVKYWPEDENKRLSFFAYAPYSTGTNGISISGTTLTYTTPTNAGNHPDLLIAASLMDQTPGGILNFQFQHALACVSFKYTGTDTLTSITLKGIKTIGTYALDASNSWTLTNTVTEITCQWTTQADPNENCYLMLLPQEPTEKVTATLTFDGNSKDIDISIPSGGWVAGNRYQYILTD